MNHMLAAAVAAIAIIGFSAAVFSSYGSAETQRPGFYASSQGECSSNDLALCLADKGAKFYGAYWCSHCANQKELFGSSAKNLPYIECDLGEGTGQSVQNPECVKAGITGFPTWIMPDGKVLRGEQQLSTLGELSGCFDYA